MNSVAIIAITKRGYEENCVKHVRGWILCEVDVLIRCTPNPDIDPYNFPRTEMLMAKTPQSLSKLRRYQPLPFIKFTYTILIFTYAMRGLLYVRATFLWQFDVTWDSLLMDYRNWGAFKFQMEFVLKQITTVMFL